MKALVLAAAKSKKLLPFSETRPKMMIHLCGAYILERLLIQLKEAGVTEVFLVVSHQQQMIRDFFGRGRELGLKIEYLVQETPGSIGEAVLLGAQPLAQEDRFLLVYADAMVTGNCFKALLDQAAQSNKANLATVTHPASEGAYGNVYLSGEMTISKLIEKPGKGRLSNYIFGGSFIFTKDCFDLLKKNGGDMLGLFQTLIGKSDLEAYLWEKGWIDISRPWHILIANQLIMKDWDRSIIPDSVVLEKGVNINGPVVFGERVRVCSGVNINGPCYIGADSFIGHSSLIRDFSSIGPGSTIGYGSEVKNAVLFGNSVVGRLSFIGDSVLGAGVHLGSGTMTINNSVSGGSVVFESPEGETLDTELVKLGAFIGDAAVIGTGHNLAPGTWISAGAVIKDHFTYPLK
ncbi:MAG: hypothetical protein A2527_08135 [Candidatus Lambdaproteobacteria bacterium RIFOXYD2_FULL_50_16]|uniref:Uncharacterized protein n=1 Tax=Candidatus Lambdaproteobacteria bacterium RIFOXYD2_FULL_50_16 TaxID=1817772 RepID=A0A1F6GAJ7_9PROT|nr:MAG: hypothetical protein A2527_08135 [Candidatus Lambdaproteobacteria bacterium RIFOXYD2_FULL_50_16]